MNNKIIELFTAIVLITFGAVMLIFGRRFNRFLEKIGIEYLAGDSPDAVRSRQVLVSITFIGIGMFLVISSLKY